MGSEKETTKGKEATRRGQQRYKKSKHWHTRAHAHTHTQRHTRWPRGTVGVDRNCGCIRGVQLTLHGSSHNLGPENQCFAELVSWQRFGTCLLQSSSLSGIHLYFVHPSLYFSQSGYPDQQKSLRRNLSPIIISGNDSKCINLCCITPRSGTQRLAFLLCWDGS